MIPVWVVLIVVLALVLALAVALYLALTLPRRVMALLFAAWSEAERAQRESAAIRTAAPVAVAGIVWELRAYHAEIARRAQAARDITTAVAADEIAGLVGRLRSLCDWLDGRAQARYAEALVAANAEVDTTRLPGHSATSRTRPSPHAPIVALPAGSSAASPGRAQEGQPPRPVPPQPRRPLGSTATLVSAVSGAEPAPRPVACVPVEHRQGDVDRGGA